MGEGSPGLEVETGVLVSNTLLAPYVALNRFFLCTSVSSSVRCRPYNGAGGLGNHVARVRGSANVVSEIKVGNTPSPLQSFKVSAWQKRSVRSERWREGPVTNPGWKGPLGVLGSSRRKALWEGWSFLYKHS